VFSRFISADARSQQPLFDAFTRAVGCGTGDLADKMACLRSASISSLAIAQDNVSATLFVALFLISILVHFDVDNYTGAVTILSTLSWTIT